MPNPKLLKPKKSSKQGESDLNDNTVRIGVWDDFFDAPGVDLGERDQPVGQSREKF